MNDAANWDLLLVLGVFTAVMCAFAWYMHTHRAPEPMREDIVSTRYSMECGRDPDGRYWATVPALPGVLVYGKFEGEVKAKATAQALRTLAERLESNQIHAHSFCFQVVSESASFGRPETERWSDPQQHLEDLERMAVESFATRECAAQWLRNPHPMLDGATPLQIALTEAGAERVKAIMIGIKYGGVV